ncbi:MAG TPA: hypothetical protein VFD32_09260, partial [Dehalococcoidia bacterium]|nr:hypothetical protein [Dehalococcoidia bacterium]
MSLPSRLAWAKTGLALLALPAPLFAITLADYADSHPLVVQTVQAGEELALGKDNQVNNLKEGGKVLVLSDRELTSLDGISRLTVVDGDRREPLAD